MLVLFAGSLLVVAGICVFAVDVGRIILSQAQLQNAVDAAALAGASQLATGTTQAEKTAASAQATTFAAANKVDGTPLHLKSTDIVFGHYDATTKTFTAVPTATIVDSIQVTGRRTTAATDGPISLIFGPIFNWNTQPLDNVVGVGTKPRRFVMFVLDRSGSMCFDTTGITTHASPNHNTTGYYMSTSTGGWYALPQTMNNGSSQTAYFYAKDNTTGLARTDVPQIELIEVV